MSMRPVRLVAGAAALAVMAGTGGWAVAGADAQPPRPVDPTGRISVTGVGNASGPPNTVIAQMHVDTSGDTVAAAMNSANAAAAAMQRALHRDGVAKSDLQTSNLSLNPTYNDRQELTGYEVTESLTATIRTLRRAGRMIADAIAAGGPAARFDNLSLDLRGDVVLTAAARQSAFQDARHKAEQFAALAGQRLGRVQSISEQVQEPPPVPFYLPFGVATADRAISSVPIRGGSQQLTIRVSVVFSMS